MSELPDAPLAIGGPTTRNTDCDQNYDSTKALDVTVHCASQAGFGDFMEHLLNSDDPVVQAKLQERLERMQPGNTDAVANTRAVRLSLSAVMPPAKSIDGVAGEVLAADSDMTSNLAVANFSGVSQIVCLYINCRLYYSNSITYLSFRSGSCIVSALTWISFLQEEQLKPSPHSPLSIRLRLDRVITLGPSRTASAPTAHYW